MLSKVLKVLKVFIILIINNIIINFNTYTPWSMSHSPYYSKKKKEILKIKETVI